MQRRGVHIEFLLSFCVRSFTRGGRLPAMDPANVPPSTLLVQCLHNITSAAATLTSAVPQLTGLIQAEQRRMDLLQELALEREQRMLAETKVADLEEQLRQLRMGSVVDGVSNQPVDLQPVVSQDAELHIGTETNFAELSIGSFFGSKWLVMGRLGGGGEGRAVYSVEDINMPELKAALKTEWPGAVGGDLLKVEATILKRLKGKEHIPELLGCGKLENYQYIAMTLLGESLFNLLHKRHRPVTISTQTRIGLQLLHGLKIIHDIGFVHGNVKPANLVLGQQGKGHIIYLLDFHLCREFVVNEKGRRVMRRPRTCPPFRGTSRYASVAALERIEQGRCDDLWSLLYVIAESRNRLPWSNVKREELVEVKRNTPDNVLLLACPIQLLDFAQHLRALNYFMRPDYMKLYLLLDEIMQEGQYKFSDPWDWDTPEETPKSIEETHSVQDTGSEWLIHPEIFNVNPFGF